MTFLCVASGAVAEAMAKAFVEVMAKALARAASKALAGAAYGAVAGYQRIRIPITGFRGSKIRPKVGPWASNSAR